MPTLDSRPVEMAGCYQVRKEVLRGNYRECQSVSSCSFSAHTVSCKPLFHCAKIVCLLAGMLVTLEIGMLMQLMINNQAMLCSFSD